MGRISAGRSLKKRQASVEVVIASLEDRALPEYEENVNQESIKMMDLKDHFDKHVFSLQDSILDIRNEASDLKSKVDNKLMQVQIDDLKTEQIMSKLNLIERQVEEQINKQFSKIQKLEEVQAQPIEIIKETKTIELQPIVENKVPQWIPVVIALEALAIIALIILK